MPSSSQPASPKPSDISGAVAEDLALYREKFQLRLPESLDELHGPTLGVVELPLHMAWSVMTSYDMSKPRRRMGLYRTVLHEGLRDDLPRRDGGRGTPARWRSRRSGGQGSARP
jgi:hypothetical protein